MSDREGRRADLGARTLAIVVGRCSRTPARLGPRLRAESGSDARFYASRAAFDSTHHAGCGGTAEVLHRQLSLVEDLAPQRVLVIESDAMRGIDYAALVDAHIAAGIGATLAFAEMAAAAEGGCGTVAVDALGRVLRLEDAAEPPRAAAHATGRTRLVCAGAYVLERDLLVDCLEVDAAEPMSAHDFRADVLPVLIRANGIAAHRAFAAEPPPAAERSRQASVDAS